MTEHSKVLQISWATSAQCAISLMCNFFLETSQWPDQNSQKCTVLSFLSLSFHGCQTCNTVWRLSWFIAASSPFFILFTHFPLLNLFLVLIHLVYASWRLPRFLKWTKTKGEGLNHKTTTMFTPEEQQVKHCHCFALYHHQKQSPVLRPDSCLSCNHPHHNKYFLNCTCISHDSLKDSKSQEVVND